MHNRWTWSSLAAAAMAVAVVGAPHRGIHAMTPSAPAFAASSATAGRRRGRPAAGSTTTTTTTTTATATTSATATAIGNRISPSPHGRRLGLRGIPSYYATSNADDGGGGDLDIDSKRTTPRQPPFSLPAALFLAGLAFDAYVEPPSSSSRWERGSSGLNVAFLSAAYTRSLYRGIVEVTPLRATDLPDEDDAAESLMTGGGVDAALLVSVVEGAWTEDVKKLEKEQYHDGVLDLAGCAHVGRSSTAWGDVDRVGAPQAGRAHPGGRHRESRGRRRRRFDDRGAQIAGHRQAEEVGEVAGRHQSAYRSGNWDRGDHHRRGRHHGGDKRIDWVRDDRVNQDVVEAAEEGQGGSARHGHGRGGHDRRAGGRGRRGHTRQHVRGGGEGKGRGGVAVHAHTAGRSDEIVEDEVQGKGRPAGGGVGRAVREARRGG